MLLLSSKIKVELKPNLNVSFFKYPCLPPNLVNLYVVIWFIIIKISYYTILMLSCFISTREICTIFPPMARDMVLGLQNLLHEGFFCPLLDYLIYYLSQCALASIIACECVRSLPSESKFLKFPHHSNS